MTIVSTDQDLLSGMHILYVDDSGEIAELVKRFLNLSGATVDTASNGKIALQMISKSESKYDLVLMDILMPIMDGKEATTALRTQGFKQPIIALTAHGRKDDRDSYLKLGFNELMIKPINRVQLVNEVTKFKRA